VAASSPPAPATTPTPQTGAAGRRPDLLTAAVDGWSRFWFRPEPTTALGLVRILFGLVVIGWAFALLPDLLTFMGRDGVLPVQPSSRYAWGPLQLWHSDRAVIAVWAVLLVGAAVLVVGWRSRVAAAVVFVCLMTLLRRDNYIFNAGDGLLRIEALLLALSPCGSALSLDRRRTAGSFWGAQVRAPWVIRLLQVQVSIIYLATVRDKLSGTTWNEGTAVSYALRLPELSVFPVPHWLTTNALLMNAATWGTLLAEIAIGVLVWHRRLRPWVLGLGVLLHLSILLTLAVGFFSWAVWVLYLAFVPPEVAQRWVDRLRARLRPAATGEPAQAPPVDGGPGRGPAREQDGPAGGAATREETGPVGGAATREETGAADVQAPTG
jgi:hypothetical protein